MSRTYRLIDYRKGKPIYARNEGQYVPYHSWRHERVEVRRELNRRYRHRAKIFLKKFGYIPVRFKTCGWVSW